MRATLGGALLVLAASAAAASADGGAPADLRARLNPGYALLYQEDEGLPHIHWLVGFKHESEPVHSLVRDSLDFWKAQAKALDALAATHPGLDLKAAPMAQVLGDAREAQGKARFHALRPVFGETGADYERDLLLLLRDAVDEQRFIVATLRKRETDPQLRDFLAQADARMQALYVRYDTQLRAYFRPRAQAPDISPAPDGPKESP